MIWIIDSSGTERPALNKVPKAKHWDPYRNALETHGDLVQAMSDAIRDAVTSDRFLDPGSPQLPNSSWLGSEILKSFALRDAWDDTYPDCTQSSTLFGQIMWTVMFVDERDWCTTVTSKATESREQRVYFLMPEKKR